MSDLKEIPEAELEFSSLAEEVVKAFKEGCRKCHPTESIQFFECGNCDLLHVTISDGDRGVMMNISPHLWKRSTKQ